MDLLLVDALLTAGQISEPIIDRVDFVEMVREDSHVVLVFERINSSFHFGQLNLESLNFVQKSLLNFFALRAKSIGTLFYLARNALNLSVDGFDEFGKFVVRFVVKRILVETLEPLYHRLILFDYVLMTLHTNLLQIFFVLDQIFRFLGRFLEVVANIFALFVQRSTLVVDVRIHVFENGKNERVTLFDQLLVQREALHVAHVQTNFERSCVADFINCLKVLLDFGLIFFQILG